MPNLSGGEILIILLVALIVLGPKRLPEAARSVSRGFKELRRVQSSVQDEINATLAEADQPYQPPTRPAGAELATEPSAEATTAPDTAADARPAGTSEGNTASDSQPDATETAAPPSRAVFRPRDEVAGRYADGPGEWGEAPLHDETS